MSSVKESIAILEIASDDTARLVAEDLTAALRKCED